MITYPLNNIDYTAEDAELFHCTRNSGIWAEDSFPISVTGADNNVTIGTGLAWINNEEFSGKVTALKTAKVLDLGIADGVYPRIDVIAIQFNANNNETDVIVKNGTPATNPVRPSIVRTGAIYELYLASVYRPAGATVITASNITDLRMDATVCGLMADSVTKVDMEAIRSQLIGLVEELEEAIQNIEVGEIVPIEKGGTNAQTSAGARQNINFIGIDPLTSPAEDTVENWIALGSGIAYISDEGLLADQPERYGYVLNMVSDSFVNQLFFSQAGHLRTYKRAGSLNGGNWYNSGAWKKILDEQNGVQMKKVWENQYPSSAFGEQNITFSDNSSYGLYLVTFRAGTNINRVMSEIVEPGKASEIQWIENVYVTSDIKLCGRQFTVNAGTARFGNSFEKEWSVNIESLTEGSGKLIPQAIYGIKSVL